MTQQQQPHNEGLVAQAARLYPHSEALQLAWLRAIAQVRGTTRGWLLDHPVQHRKNAS